VCPRQPHSPNPAFEVLLEFAWMGEKTANLARASCSTKEHIRAIDGSVLVEEASNLQAGHSRAEMAELEVAQNALCSTAHPGLAILRQRIDTHRRSSKQIPEEPYFQGARHILLRAFTHLRSQKQKWLTCSLFRRLPFGRGCDCIRPEKN